MRQQADYLRESIDRINRVDPQPGEDEELNGAHGGTASKTPPKSPKAWTRALGALDASQVDVDDVESALRAADLIDRAVDRRCAPFTSEGMFSELADRLDSISTDLSDVVFSPVPAKLDNEGERGGSGCRSTGASTSLDELTRRWGPDLVRRDHVEGQGGVYDLEDLDASPEKVEQLEAERAQTA